MITLVLGGARSGKSLIAERIATRLPSPVTYIATATATDDDMAARIAAHRARRPSVWTTVEVGEHGDLVGYLQSAAGTVLLDSLGTWLAAQNLEPGSVVGEKLAHALTARDGDTVVVSEEVGLSVHPPTEVGRRFVDALGLLNQAVAVVADDVLLAVAGRAMKLEAEV